MNFSLITRINEIIGDILGTQSNQNLIAATNREFIRLFAEELGLDQKRIKQLLGAAQRNAVEGLKIASQSVSGAQ